MYTLYIGNRNYSSWSLRGWLAVKLAGVPFVEKLVPLVGKGPNADWRAFSPSGLVPALHDGPLVVWESLAIAEYLAEKHPGLWPDDRAARAVARAMAAEMHAGFRDLRNDMTMCIRERVDVRPWSLALQSDVARVEALWNDARGRFGAGGPYLFGRFSLADAFFGPVAFRLRTYDVRPGGAAGDYLQALLVHPFMCEWEAAALAETEVIEADEPRLLYRDKLKAAGRL